MAFRSKRLRVQLPCGERTVFEMDVFVECPMGTVCLGGSFPCDPSTCVFGVDSRIGPGGLCKFQTCDIGTVVPCGAGTDPCVAGSPDPVVDPGAVLIDPQDLGAFKQHLEERLKEIDAAQQAIEERRKSG